MKIKLDEGAMITTAHETDAGFDLYSRTTKVTRLHSLLLCRL